MPKKRNKKLSKLIREFLDLKYDEDVKARAKHAAETSTPLSMKAILQRADIENQNHRIYPMPILQREVENYKKAVVEGRASGELDHPDTQVVSLKEVSHVIKDIWWEGSEVVGLVEIHPKLPRGKEALGLIEAGVKLGISSRGIGNVLQNESGTDIVDEDFMLIAFDLVSEPSTHEAWLMKEGKEISREEVFKTLPKKDRLNRILNEILQER